MPTEKHVARFGGSYATEKHVSGIIMSLSNSVKLHMIDATTNNTSVSIFKIPPMICENDWTLAKFGVYSAAGANNEFFYPSRAGIAAAVKSVQIWIQGTKVDEVQEFPTWASIQNMLVSNEYAEDIQRFELLNGTSAVLENIENTNVRKYTYQPRLRDYANSFPLAAANANVAELTVRHDQLHIPTTTAGSTGLLDLSRYLGLLKANPIIYALPELELRIQWNLTAGQYLSDDNANGAAAVSGITNFNPILILKERLDKAQPEKIEMPYFSAQLAKKTVAAVANGTAQDETLLIESYNGKMLKDLIIFNKPSAAVNGYKAFECSLAQENEKIQLNFNKGNWLPRNGLDTPAVKMATFTDAIGPLNTSIVSYLPKLTDAGAIFADDDVANRPSSSVNSTFSVAGIKIGQVINRTLQVRYQRTGTNNAALSPANEQTKALTLLLYGSVAQVLEVKGDQVRISY